VNVNEQAGVAVPPQGRGILYTAVAKGALLITGAIDKMYQAGCGLLKSFQGLFGGLGTSEAETGRVTGELGIDGSDNIEAVNTPEENKELEAEVKEPTAGGLGGLFSLTLEAASQATDGRSFRKASDGIGF